MRFRLRSVLGGRTWEYRVYGPSATRPAGTFAITDATGGGADGFIMAPGVGEDVLTLTGQSGQFGSIDNTADIVMYTTPGTGGLGTNVPNVRLWDWSNDGGAARWLPEDGLTHTRIAPAISGTGGFFEIAGGSIRLHDPAVQKKVFEVIGLSEEEGRDKFGFLLDALSYGAPPHGGIAFGMDRVAMLAAQTESIRDVIAFPKTPRANDLMTGAPGRVDAKQLAELGVAVTDDG